MPDSLIIPLPTVLAPLLPAGHEASIEFVRTIRTKGRGRVRVVLQSAEYGRWRMGVLDMQGQFRGPSHLEAACHSIADAVVMWAARAFTPADGDAVLRFVLQPTPTGPTMGTLAAPCDVSRLTRLITDTGLQNTSIRAAVVRHTLTGAVAAWHGGALVVQAAVAPSATPHLDATLDAMVDPIVRPDVEDWMLQYADFLAGFDQISVCVRFPNTGHALMQAAARAASQRAS